MADKPFEDSLWMDCLMELMQKVKKGGVAYVNFSDVDELVIEKSKGISKYELKEDKNGKSTGTGQ